MRSATTSAGMRSLSAEKGTDPGSGPVGGGRTDEERVVKLIEHTRLLLAIDDDVSIETKLNAQSVLKMFEAAVVSRDAADHELAVGYYRQLYAELSSNGNIEALLSAMRVFLPYL